MADNFNNGALPISAGPMPFSPEAEQSVLGAILLDSSCLDRVTAILPRSDYFYQVNNAKIYETMLAMSTEGKPVDFVTVLEKLKGEPSFDEASGRLYLMQLAQLVPSITNVESYARIVRDKYDVRTLIMTARDILDNASDGGTDPDMLLDSAEQRIFDIRSGKNMQGLQHIKDVLMDTFDRLDMLNSDDAELYRGISTGIGDLDSVMTGLNRSDLIVLAARPGMGKTSFALNIACNVSMSSGRRVAMFSLEMSREQLSSRLLSMKALVEGTKLRTGKLDDNEWARLIEAGDLLSKSQIYLDDNPQITVNEIKSQVRRLKDVNLIIIDYLQLMGSSTRIENRVQEISMITRNLKIMAKELNVPVIVLSQLSRSTDKRGAGERRPVLSDLRDSGSIEQDADIVLFLYREDYYQRDDAPAPDEDKNSCECIVAKNRHGETTTVNLHWQGEFMRFTAREVYRGE